MEFWYTFKFSTNSPPARSPSTGGAQSPSPAISVRGPTTLLLGMTAFTLIFQCFTEIIFFPSHRFVPRRSPNRKLGVDLLPHRAATTVAAGDAPPVGYLSPSSEVPEELDEDEEEDEDAGVPAAPHAASPSSTRRCRFLDLLS